MDEASYALVQYLVDYQSRRCDLDEQLFHYCIVIDLAQPENNDPPIPPELERSYALLLRKLPVIGAERLSRGAPKPSLWARLLQPRWLRVIGCSHGRTSSSVAPTHLTNSGASTDMSPDRTTEPNARLWVASGSSVEAIGEIDARSALRAPKWAVARGEDRWDRIRGGRLCRFQPLTPITFQCSCLDPLGRSARRERPRVWWACGLKWSEALSLKWLYR